VNTDTNTQALLTITWFVGVEKGRASQNRYICLMIISVNLLSLTSQFDQDQRVKNPPWHSSSKVASATGVTGCLPVNPVCCWNASRVVARVGEQLALPALLLPALLPPMLLLVTSLDAPDTSAGTAVEMSSPDAAGEVGEPGCGMSSFLRLLSSWLCLLLLSQGSAAAAGPLLKKLRSRIGMAAASCWKVGLSVAAAAATAATTGAAEKSTARVCSGKLAAACSGYDEG
jgi:hypothetical protein